MRFYLLKDQGGLQRGDKGGRYVNTVWIAGDNDFEFMSVPNARLNVSRRTTICFSRRGEQLITKRTL